MAYTEKVTFEIDLSKIDKSAIKEVASGKWMKVTLVPTPDNQYNEYLVSQYIGKGQSGVILGNGNDMSTVMDKINGNSKPVQLEESSDKPLPF